ncbi:MAG: DUF6807 family protein [Pirellulales bacterium]
MPRNIMRISLGTLIAVGVLTAGTCLAADAKQPAAAKGAVKAQSPFRFAPIGDKSLGLWEGAKPVLVYNFGTMSKPGVPADRNRSSYVHPIYGLDGEVLTDDFPKDHYHHRGLFWGWPHVGIDGKQYDLWAITGIWQRFDRWLKQEAGPAVATLGVENGWYVGDKKVVREQVWLRVHPATADGRAIDVDLTWVPIDSPLTLAGAEGKSYGGLTLRFAPAKDVAITVPEGRTKEDLYITRLPWADLSARFGDAKSPSGAAIFVSPDHPDYPPTWLTRHYGVLCLGWPGVKPATFQPGVPIRCSYRVWLHRGAPDAAKLKEVYRGYAEGKKAGK